MKQYANSPGQSRGGAPYGYRGTNPGYNEQGVPVGPAFSALPSPPPAHASGGTPIQELVPIPPKLVDWANSNHMLQCLFNVKKQLRGSTILEAIREGDDPSGAVTNIMVEAPTTEDAKLARSLLQMSFKNEERIGQTRDRRASLEDELYSAQGALAAGTVVEFAVSDDIVGLLIGKKGARIKRIQDEFDVKQIKVNNDKVVIVGKDHKSAEEARRELEIFKEELKLDDEAFNGLKEDLRSLQEIKSSTDLLVASMLHTERSVLLIGTAHSMYQAKVLLSHQLEFARAASGERERERDTLAKLRQFTTTTGFPLSDRGGDRRGGRGGRDGERGNREGGRGNGGHRHMTTPIKTVGPPKNARANAKPTATTSSKGAAVPPVPPAGDSRPTRKSGERAAAGTKQTLADAKAAKGGSAGTKNGPTEKPSADTGATKPKKASKGSAATADVTKEVGGRKERQETKDKKKKEKNEDVGKVTKAMETLTTEATEGAEFTATDKKKRTRAKKASTSAPATAAATAAADTTPNTTTKASNEKEKDTKKTPATKQKVAAKKESADKKVNAAPVTDAAEDPAVGAAEVPLAKRTRKRRSKGTTSAVSAADSADATLVE